MGHNVVSLTQFRSPRGDWSNQELAEFWRVERLLSEAGLPIELDHGLTDEDEPWFVFVHADTGDVFAHFARLDGRYVLIAFGLDSAITGSSFRDIVDRFLERYPSVRVPPRGKGPNRVFVHPAAALAAMIVTLFFLADASTAPVHAHTGADGDTAAGQDGHDALGAIVYVETSTDASAGVTKGSDDEDDADSSVSEARGTATARFELGFERNADRSLAAGVRQTASSADVSCAYMSAMAVLAAAAGHEAGRTVATDAAATEVAVSVNVAAEAVPAHDDDEAGVQTVFAESYLAPGIDTSSVTTDASSESEWGSAVRSSILGPIGQAVQIGKSQAAATPAEMADFHALPTLPGEFGFAWGTGSAFAKSSAVASAPGSPHAASGKTETPTSSDQLGETKLLTEIAEANTPPTVAVAPQPTGSTDPDFTAFDDLVGIVVTDAAVTQMIFALAANFSGVRLPTPPTAAVTATQSNAQPVQAVATGPDTQAPGATPDEPVTAGEPTAIPADGTPTQADGADAAEPAGSDVILTPDGAANDNGTSAAIADEPPLVPADEAIASIPAKAVAAKEPARNPSLDLLSRFNWVDDSSREILRDFLSVADDVRIAKSNGQVFVFEWVVTQIGAENVQVQEIDVAKGNDIVLIGTTQTFAEFMALLG
jgi:hypothetical protein